MKIIILLFALSHFLLLSHAQTVALVSDTRVVQDANVYAGHSVKIIDTKEPSAAQTTDLVVVEKPKLGVSQKFNGISTEDSLIELVETAIRENPDEACEVVKQAIAMSKANDLLIARIVEAAILAAPEQIRLITQCAIAAAPDSLAEINRLLAAYDAAGDASTSGKEVTGKEVTGKEGYRQEVASMPESRALLPLDSSLGLDVLSVSEPGAAALARSGLLPKTVPWPQTISPNVATNSDVKQ